MKRSAFLFTCLGIALVAIGIGLYMSGSPTKARAQKYDQQRVNDLQQITYALDQYWTRTSNLPQRLEELVASPEPYYLSSIRDPRTHTPYEFRAVTGSGNYELCATFETDSTQPSSPSLARPMEPLFWQHSAGRTCFPVQIRTLRPGTM